MRTELTFYNDAERLLPASSKLELLTIFDRLPVPIWPGKSKSNAKLSLMQIMLNALLRELFLEYGWSLEPSYGQACGYYGDAYKEVNGLRMMVEAEFGNAARSGVDVCKFLGACLEHKTIDIGIQLTVLKDTAQYMDSNVALYEDTQKLVSLLGSIYKAPTLLVGFNAEGSNTVDIRDFGFSLKSLKNNAKLTRYIARSVLGLPCDERSVSKLPRTGRTEKATAAGQLCLC